MTHTEAVKTLASERYLLGEMTDAERLEFEDHFFGCAECAADVRVGGLMADGARAGFARNPQSRWNASIAVPYAIAAGLALVVGYQALAPRPNAGRGGGALALSPATLRPATRGEDPVVQTGAGGAIALAVDLGGAAYDGGLRYELRQDGGEVLASGEALAPPAGAPLLLFVPGSVVHASSRYVLTVRASSTGVAASEYRFIVAAP
ncbi:MAG TPA: zf-HC2 domain-containing protein [Vicinamibacterales bacterium]|nr:zf-HC2 domain-containing protein [Vicinamibacterales bacterium]